MKKKLISILIAVGMLICPASSGVTAADTEDGMNMYKNSDFIEKEQPELDEETKRAISRYQKDPTDENYLALRELVIKDYDEVVARKEAKLAELKEETAGKPGGEELVAEMAELVQEIHDTYWDRINSSMLRFTDPRLLKWKISDAYKYEYIPVMGAGESVYIKRTPVTNAEYAEFIGETGHNAPSNWTNGTYPEGEDDYPVNFVSYDDAEAYCAWLTANDGVNVYRMPSESEWELAAGHMPKDADFNCRVNNGRTPVDQYADVTRGAHGAVDFWGNVWEWTSTVRESSDGVTILGVKGGSWSSERTDCRTEYREEGRDSANGYEDVGFRVIRILNGEEPESDTDTAADTTDGETGLPFTDVKKSDGFFDAVKYVYENGLFDGVSDSEFAPSDTMTRAMFVTVLGRMAKADVSAYTSASYKDASVGEWYTPYVEWAADKGIADGYDNDTFGVNDAVTVEQAAVIFARYAEANGISVEYSSDISKYSDTANVSDWAFTPLMWAAENRIYTANGRMLRPKAAASRALLAKMCYGYASEFSDTASRVSSKAAGAIGISSHEYNGMNYLLYTPENAAENMPLIVYLHGISGKGDNPEQLLDINEFPKFLAEGDIQTVPAYILMPQLSADSGDWISCGESVVNLTKYAADLYGIDSGNISLTGFSMGGVGVWSIAASYPETFSRIAPLSGGVRSSEKMLSALSDTPVWAFVGTADTVVDPRSAIDFTELLEQQNPQAKITEFDGAKHTDVPALAFLDDEIGLVNWLVGK